MTALDIITDALMEINVVGQGEQAANGDAQFALRKLNRLLDSWAARSVYIYNVNFSVFQLVPGLSPHTIGPKGAITRTALLNGVATYQCVENLTNGDSVTVTGTANGGGALNVTGRVQAATATQFSLPVIHADIAAAADAGTVVQASSSVPTFATPSMGQRPQRVEQAELILNNTGTNVDIPLNIRDDDWWGNNRVKSLQSNVPTDLYYSPDWPNGSLYFWPVPNFAYGVRLKLWGPLPKFPALNYVFNLPPGYEEGIVMSLARSMVGAFKGDWSAQQESAWMRATKAIEANNIQSPRGTTADAGMPGTGQRSGFNYYRGY